MQLSRLVALIEHTAPLQAAASWDHSGMQVLGEATEVDRVAVALDPTRERIAACLAWGASFILTHHPLSFKPQSLGVPGAYLDVARALIRHGASLYSAHTSLDANPRGPAGRLATRLGMAVETVLEPTWVSEAAGAKKETYGLGWVGELPEPLPAAAFAALMAKELHPGCLMEAGARPARIRRVAVCPGSGSSLAQAAADAGADVLVTGDIKYHAALDAPLFMLDVGHFSLEEQMMRQFCDLLRNAAPDVTFQFFSAADPIRVAVPASDRQS